MSLSTLKSYSSTQSQRPSGSVSHPTQSSQPTTKPSQNYAPDHEPSGPEFIIQGQPPAEEEDTHNQTPEGKPSSIETEQEQSPAVGKHNQSHDQLVQARNITHSNYCDPADGPADSERGSKCDFICLDGRYNRKGDFQIKLSTLPLDADQQEEREWEKYAIISTRQFNPKGVHVETNIEITSPHILKALKYVTPYYPDAPVITKTSVTYYSPFELLVHCFEDLNDYRDKSVDDVAKLHVGLLIRVIRLEVGAKLNELEGLLSAKKITYRLAWAIFRPGTIVFTEVNDEPEQYRVHSTVYVSKDMGAVRFMRVYVEQIDFDGKYFKTRRSCIIIPGFNGVAPIASLLVYPSKFHPEHDTIVRSIVKRGHKWYEIQSAAPKTMTLTATCKCVGKDNKAPKFTISGRIVVDNAIFRAINPDWLPRAGEGSFNPSDNREDRSDGDDSDGDDSDGDDSNNYILAQGQLKDDEAGICTAFLHGYSLNKRLWGYFPVEHAKEVEWMPNSFDRLILSPEPKQAIMALVKSYINTPPSTLLSDLVRGKGLGMIFLLHGPPGVGKTLTAETIAEDLQRPLYVVGGGELGTTPDSVDRRLSEIMDIATVWKAIVLIDEVDVFIQKRDLHNLERNSLVSIFLRKLEYYEGMMFLTTNRVDCIDDAFQSRIDVTLKMPELTADMRRQLWEASIKDLNPDTYEIDFETALPRLEMEQMNGRDIRNTIKGAHLMASHYGEKLTLDRLFIMMGFRMTGSFQEKI